MHSKWFEMMENYFRPKNLNSPKQRRVVCCSPPSFFLGHTCWQGVCVTGTIRRDIRKNSYINWQHTTASSNTLVKFNEKLTTRKSNCRLIETQCTRRQLAAIELRENGQGIRIEAGLADRSDRQPCPSGVGPRPVWQIVRLFVVSFNLTN